MAKVIKELTLQNMGHMAGDQHGEYLDSQLLMVMSKSFMRTCQPYRIEDGRVLRIISGTAQFIINMKPYCLTTGMMVVMPAGTVMEIEEKDEDFDFQIFSFRDLPADVTFKEDTVLLLSADDWILMGEYFQLLRHSVSRHEICTIHTGLHHVRTSKSYHEGIQGDIPQSVHQKRGGFP